MPFTSESRKALQDKVTEGKRAAQRQRKDNVLQALRKHLGVVTPSLAEAGVDRNTYQQWLTNDPEFVAQVEQVHEELLDFGEKALIQKLKDADTQTILFFAKNKLRNRGYGDKQEVNATGEITIRIVEGDNE